MGKGMEMFWWADAMASDMQRRTSQIRSNAELAKAEIYHCGTIAVLAAAIRELQRLDADNPLHRRAVRDAIDADGERAGNFQAAWRLPHDPPAILAGLQEARKTAVAALLPKAEAEPIKPTRGGFLWLSRRWVWWNNTYKRLEHAEQARTHILASLRLSDVDEPSTEKAIKLAAWRAIGL